MRLVRTTIDQIRHLAYHKAKGPAVSAYAQIDLAAPLATACLRHFSYMFSDDISGTKRKILVTEDDIEHLGTQRQQEHIAHENLGGESWKKRYRSMSLKIKGTAYDTLLPRGYPESVSHGYMPYIQYQAVQHVCSSANMVIGTTFLLYSLGASEGAIPTAGALNWILKDGIGYLGTLLFGRHLAYKFDYQSKLWYILSLIQLDLAVIAEIWTVAKAEYFLILASTANMVKGLSWMVGGATRTAFNVNFAKQSNIADLTAKATSQTICSYLIGNTFGMAICASVGQDVGLAIASCSLLSSAHIWSGWKCTTHVPLSTINLQVIRTLLDSLKAGKAGLPGPYEFAQAQSIQTLNPLSGHATFESLKTCIADHFQENPRYLYNILKEMGEEDYMVWIEDGSVYILLQDKALSSSILRAYFHACILEDAMHAAQEGVKTNDDWLECLRLSNLQMREVYGEMESELKQSEWDLENIPRETFIYSATWHKQ